MNPQDSNVNGELADNPIASPAETITPEESSDVNPQGASTTNPEEVAWNSLKGTTQGRVKQLLAEQDRLKAENERLMAFAQYAQAPQYQNQGVPQGPLPEVRDAVQKLAEVGIATDAKVDAKITQRMGDLIYNMEMQRLEGKFDGDDGLPKFDRQEFQDFIQKNPKFQAYDPEDVYKYHMYREEIADVTNRKTNGQSTTSSLKPTKTVVREEQWTPDWIENRMKQSDGLQWYAKNRDKVNTFLSSTFSNQ